MFGFIGRNIKKGLVYSGDIVDVEYCVDDAEALARYRHKTDNVEFIETSVAVYGKKFIYKLPIYEGTEDLQEYNYEFREYLANKGKERLISDVIIGIRQEFLKTHDICSDGVNGFFCFKAKIATSLTETQQKSKEEVGEMIMKKELLDGYVRVDDYKLKNGSSYESVPISADYEFADGIVPYNYTAKLRLAMFGDDAKKLNTGKMLMDWQYDVIRNMGRMTFVCGPRRCGKCVSFGENVKMNDGNLIIAEKLRIGDAIMGSHNKSVKIKDIEHYEKECVKITLKNGQSKVVTYDHRCPTQKTFSKGNRDLDIDNYKQAEELNKDDFIPSVFDIENNSKKGSYGDGLFLGAYLGDGNHTNYRICNPNKLLQEKLMKHLPNIFYQHEEYLRTKYEYFEKMQEKYDLNHLSGEKYIHGTVFGKANKFKRGVVNGLLATDGYIKSENEKQHIDGYKRKAKVGIEYCSVSEKLTNGLQQLLMELGVFCYKRTKVIRSNFKSKNKIAHYLYITETDSLKRLFDNVDLSMKKNYNNVIGVLNQKGYTNSSLNTLPICSFKEKTAKGKSINGRCYYNGEREPWYNYQRRKAENYGTEKWLEYSWNQVVSVEPMGRQKVVHIEVDGDHIYQVNGILTHNTFLMSFLTQREIIGQKFGFQNSLRPISVVYIGLTRAKNLKVVNYVSKMISKMGAENMFKFDASSNNYRFLSGKDVLGEVTFVSAEGKDPGVGDYADLIILDEAGLLPESIFKGVEPIVYTEGAKLIAISTLYRDSKKGRFFEKLLDFELKTEKMTEAKIHNLFNEVKKLDLTDDDDKMKYTELVKNAIDDRFFVGLRYTIDDIEYISPKEKDRLRDQYSKDLTRYMSELYSRFPDEGKVFEYEQVLQSQEKVKDYHYRYIVIGYDPALTHDTSPLVVVGYNESSNKPVIFQEYDLPLGVKYDDQIKEIIKVIDYMKRYVTNPSDIFFVMDGSHKATAEILQMKGINVHLRVQFTAGNDVSLSRIHNEHKVPKRYMVDIVRNFIINNAVEISSGVQRLIKELDGFQEIETQAGNIKYEGVGTTDDKVCAMLVAMYYVSDVLGLKYQIMSIKKTEGKTIDSQKTEKDMLMEFYENKQKNGELNDMRQKILEKNKSYFRKNIY